MDKNILVLGATGAIGKQIAIDLAKLGYNIFLHGNRQTAELQKIQKELSVLYPNNFFVTIQSDLSEFHEEDWKVIQGGLQGIIIASGVTNYQLFDEQSNKIIDNIFNVNVITPIKIIKYLSKNLKKTENSRIIFISSIYGEIGSPMEVVYSSSKGAVNSFVNAYAKEIASLGMTINAIAPGAIDTPMNYGVMDEDLHSQMPSGRFGLPSDISYAVMSIMDQKSEYLNGTVINLTGGWLK